MSFLSSRKCDSWAFGCSWKSVPDNEKRRETLLTSLSVIWTQPAAAATLVQPCCSLTADCVCVFEKEPIHWEYFVCTLLSEWRVGVLWGLPGGICSLGVTIANKCSSCNSFLTNLYIPSCVLTGKTVGGHLLKELCALVQMLKKGILAFVNTLILSCFAPHS